ncbi:uncharacterized protein TNIN_254461 [Trichonephila inaurata madagascariensis]|uniref:Granulins domain-containing protein n=1 Tax=Trichonephila inaurata madagascariensis TaxID=2747483 RepID=A0A8X6XUN1_9ARAC|nr:uncharacterized protein TNIN_254461 [Trichonephila inaurata madagascariensis]
MRLLLLVVILPCVFGAETFCLDGTACPEGTKCCTAEDGQIRCCDIHDYDSGSMIVRSRKTLKDMKILDCCRSRKREKTAPIMVPYLVVPSVASVLIVKFSVRFKSSLSDFASSEAKLSLKSPINRLFIIIGSNDCSNL